MVVVVCLFLVGTQENCTLTQTKKIEEFLECSKFSQENSRITVL